MIHKEFQPFIDCCSSRLNELLTVMGFRCVGAYQFMYRITIEYSRQSDILFVGCDAGALDVELIRNDPSGNVWRIDLPKTLGLRGNRDLVLPGRSCCQQLDSFVSHSDYWIHYLEESWDIDPRMCFSFGNPADGHAADFLDSKRSQNTIRRPDQ